MSQLLVTRSIGSPLPQGETPMYHAVQCRTNNNFEGCGPKYDDALRHLCFHLGIPALSLKIYRFHLHTHLQCCTMHMNKIYQSSMLITTKILQEGCPVIILLLLYRSQSKISNWLHEASPWISIVKERRMDPPTRLLTPSVWSNSERAFRGDQLLDPILTRPAYASLKHHMLLLL